MTEKTPFQVLHLQRLSEEFGVDIDPTQTLGGSELEAWINQAEDDLQARLLAELRDVTAECCPPYPAG